MMVVNVVVCDYSEPLSVFFYHLIVSEQNAEQEIKQFVQTKHNLDESWYMSSSEEIAINGNSRAYHVVADLSEYDN